MLCRRKFFAVMGMSNDGDWREILVMAAMLDLVPPDAASTEECRQWLSWWRPSYYTATNLSDEQKKYLKNGGWWPPVTAFQIENIPPDIVKRTSRPELFSEDEKEKPAP